MKRPKKKEKKKYEKYCNQVYPGVCGYKALSDCFAICIYDGYCDYQTPRDSRQKE